MDFVVRYRGPLLSNVPKIRTEKEPQGRLRWLPPEEATKSLAACEDSKNDDLVDLVELSLFTGLRRGEVLGLTWDHVDRSRGVIRIEITKSGHRRDVPLSSNADAVLARRWSEGAKGHVFGSHKWNHYRSAWEAAVDRAKLGDLRFHDLRHHAESRIMRGRDIYEAQATPVLT